MNPIPYGVPVPTIPLLANGYAPLIMLCIVAGVLMAWVVLLWPVGVTRQRERVYCPVHARVATVVVRLAPDGSPRGVLRCSILGRRPTACAQACLRPAQA